MKPQIVIEDYQGRLNAGGRVEELRAEGLYEDCSTICIVPTRGQITAKVVQNWMGMITPMNQKFTRIFMIGMEVGAAYQQAIESIVAHPDLSKWKYLLALEEDNTPPPDGLPRLLAAMHQNPQYAAIGGLYWTKGEAGQPMAYGRPDQFPINFIPQIPEPDTLTEVNGLGMGFTLFRMELFTGGKIEKPWFQTVQTFEPGKGTGIMTQDLYFFQKARQAGYRFAVDSRVKVGHYSFQEDITW